MDYIFKLLRISRKSDCDGLNKNFNSICWVKKLGTFQSRIEDYLEVSQMNPLDHKRVNKEITDKLPTRGKRKIFFNFRKSTLSPQYFNISVRDTLEGYKISKEQWESPWIYSKRPPRLGGICRYPVKYRSIFAGPTNKLREIIGSSWRDIIHTHPTHTVLYYSSLALFHHQYSDLPVHVLNKWWISVMH